MAPATKRRKLEHSDSEAESEGSFAGFDDTNGVEVDGSDAEDASDNGSDVSMNGAEEVEDDENMSDEDEDEDEDEDVFEEDQDVHPSRKQTTAGKATSASKPLKRPALSLQDGVYTAETFKSNMFKLQVDELLDQVKLKYGKKEAPAENAMRTLKTIIEQIPDRDPLPVRTQHK
jgi:U3 small nucleolar RNA-associated protein 22